MKSIFSLFILIFCSFLSIAQYKVDFLNYRTLPSDKDGFKHFSDTILKIPMDQRITYLDALKKKYAEQGKWTDYHFYINVITEQLWVQRKFDESSTRIRKALPIIQQNIDTLSGEYMQTIYDLFYSLQISSKIEDSTPIGLRVYRLALARPHIDSMSVNFLLSISGTLAMASYYGEAYHALAIARNKALAENWAFYKQNIPVFLGFAALMEGKTDAAIVFYEEAKSQNNLSSFSDSSVFLSNLEGLTYQHVRQGEFEKAIEYSLLGLEINEILRRTRRYPAFGRFYTNFNSALIKSYLNTNREVEAIEIYRNLSRIEKKAKNFPKLVQLTTEYAQVNQALEKPDIAYVNFRKAKQIADSISFQNIKFILEIYQGLSESTYALRKFDLATRYAHDGLQKIAGNPESIDLYSLPQLDYMQNTSTTIKMFLAKQLALYKFYSQEPSEQLFKAIINHFTEFEGQVFKVLSTSNDASFVAELQKHYKSALDGLVDFFAENQSSPLVMSKSNFLIKSVLNSKATLLKQKILEQNMVRAFQSDQESFRRHNEIRREIFTVTNQRKVASGNNELEIEKLFIQQLATLYAEGLFIESQLRKSSTQFTSLASLAYIEDVGLISRELSNDEALLEYHLTANTIFSLCINSQTFNITLKPIDNLNAHVIDLIRGTKTGLLNISTSEIHKYLIEPHEQLLNNKSKLVVIPNEMLAQLPFELITTSHNQTLIHRHSIAYNYSSALWLMNREKEKTKSAVKSMLAVAPVFASSSSGEIFVESSFRSHFTSDSLVFRANALAAIPQSAEEIIAVKTMVEKQWGINVDILLHSQATKDKFMQKLAHTDIAHLATHGFVDRANPFVSGLALFPNNDKFGTNDIFFHYELYNMDLNANLVVLSACNTGVGSIDSAEGILAIPRGFIFAGVPNVIASLWKVHDQKTKQFMVEFYNHLLNGNSYAEALRRAKLHFISTGYLPMDWAGFVLIGG